MCDGGKVWWGGGGAAVAVARFRIGACKINILWTLPAH